MALTNISIENLPIRKSRYERADIQGLCLRVAPSGRKAWSLRYTVQGERKKLIIGDWPDMSIQSARDLADKYRAIARNGRDPAVDHKTAKDALRDGLTLAAAVNEFWEEELSARKGGAETLRMFNKDVVPRIGWMPMKEIKRRDVVLVVDAVRKRGYVIANRTLGAISRLFTFALDRGIIDEPLAMPKKKSEKDRTRKRVLSDGEIKLFWAAMDESNGEIDIYRQTKLALKMILLTGQRPGEVVGMRFDELDNMGNWNIPGTRMKNKEAQALPLPPLAHEIIESARQLSDGEYVFQSSQSDGPLFRNALARAVKRHHKQMGIIDPFTPHDLRRTVRTKLAEIGVDDIVAEKVMSHKLQGVLGVYNRHPYLDEKRLALSRWEAHLKQITGMSEIHRNVIFLAKK